MSTMYMLLMLLGLLLAILTVLLIYKSTLENHEDDQLFLGASESHMAKEQEELQTRIGKIDPMVRWLSAASGAVLLVIAGMWLYGGLNRSF